MKICYQLILAALALPICLNAQNVFADSDKKACLKQKKQEAKVCIQECRNVHDKKLCQVPSNSCGADCIDTFDSASLPLDEERDACLDQSWSTFVATRDNCKTTLFAGTPEADKCITEAVLARSDRNVLCRRSQQNERRKLLKELVKCGKKARKCDVSESS